MKKIFLLLFAIIMTNSLYSQIEEFDASTFSEHNAKPVVKDITTQKKELLDTNPYPPCFYDGNCEDLHLYLVGQQLYYISDSLGMSKLDGWDVLVDSDKRVITLSNNHVVALERASAKKYYNVIDVLVFKEEMSSLIAQLESYSSFISDATTYVEYGLFGSKKNRTYTYTKNDALQILKEAKRIYVLQDEKGKYFYIPYYSSCGSFDPKLKSLEEGSNIGDRQIVTLLDFISVDGYNHIKKKYAGEDVVWADNALSYVDDDVYKVENIVIKDRSVTAILYHEKKDTRYVEQIRDYYKRTIGNRSDSLYCMWGWCLRSEADSIKYLVGQRELIAEREKKAKDEQKRKEVINKYGETIGQSILAGKACVGMTKEACKEALGTPDKVSSSSSSYGNMEVWVYSYWYQISNGLSPIIQVIFENDKVTSVNEYTDNAFLMGL